MTEKEAKKIGSTQALTFVAVGLLIAQLIVTAIFSSDKNFLKAFFWFITTHYKLNILVGNVLMFLSGHFYGELAGKAILINKQNSILVGFLAGVAVLLTTGFLSGWTGFIQEGFSHLGTNDNPFEDYIFKPLYWVTKIGIVPVSLVGIWFGERIKIKGKHFT